MSKNYKQTATNVLRLVGGEKNITLAEHCSTRLRFTLVDSSKVDTEALKKTAGVMGVIASGPQCQVVIGNDVIEVYDELIKLGSFGKGTAASAKKKQPIGAVILDYMVGIFQPLIPAIAGAGILKSLITVLLTVGVLTADDTVYKVFSYVGDAALYYMPILVAITTATKFNCNKMTAAALVSAMVLPSTATLLATEGGATLFGLTLQSIGYNGQVFPAILTVIFMSFIEKWVNKWCPKAIRVFFVPMVCFVVTFPVALLVLGPLGYNMGTLLTAVMVALNNKMGWLASAILAAILPFMISLGMHKALIPYAVSCMVNTGYDMFYLPAGLATNISQGGACLGVAMKTKDENLRSTAFSAGISGLFGIGEPALFGVTLPHKRAMLGAVLSSFIGGLFIGLMKVRSYVACGAGLASMAMFVDPNDSSNFLYACIGLVISLVLSFVFTYFLYKDEAPVEGEKHAASGATTLVSPMDGKAVPLSEVKDDVFNQGILGSGIAIIPAKGELYAPADGTINLISDAKHAVSMIADNGAEILMHIGFDTVRLKGEGYDVKVATGSKVKKGQLLVKFDIDAMKAAGYDVTTPVVITNGDGYVMELLANGAVAPGAALMNLEVKA